MWGDELGLNWNFGDRVAISKCGNYMIGLNRRPNNRLNDWSVFRKRRESDYTWHWADYNGFEWFSPGEIETLGHAKDWVEEIAAEDTEPGENNVE